MGNLITRNSKFAVIALDDATSHLTDVVSVGNGVFFCPKAPFEVDPQWQKWIGSLRTKEIERANLVLLVSRASIKPQVLDDENQELERVALLLWYSVLIVGVPAYTALNVASGGKLADEIQIRQVSRLPEFYYNVNNRPLEFGIDSAREAGRIFKAMDLIYQDPQKFHQLRRGLKSFQRAVAEEIDYDRLHGFVRALDAVVMTEKGKGRTQFVQRCRLFAKAEAETGAILKLMYDLRSRVEYQTDWNDLFPDFSEIERLRRANQITRQAEALARATYRAVLLESSFLYVFEETHAVKEAWERRAFDSLNLSEEKKADLAAIAPPAFHY